MDLLLSLLFFYGCMILIDKNVVRYFASPKELSENIPSGRWENYLIN